MSLFGVRPKRDMRWKQVVSANPLRIAKCVLDTFGLSSDSIKQRRLENSNWAAEPLSDNAELSSDEDEESESEDDDDESS